MSASQAFAQAYAEELQYRTNARVTYYGDHTMEVQGFGGALPANTVRIKHKVTEITLTFGSDDVTISSSLTDGTGRAEPGFAYGDQQFYQKMEKALTDKGLHFIKSRQQWERHKEAS